MVVNILKMSGVSSVTIITLRNSVKERTVSGCVTIGAWYYLNLSNDYNILAYFRNKFYINFWSVHI